VANQIKFDLGSMIRQVDELAKAIEKLGISTQSSFSSMAASTGTLGRAVAEVSSVGSNPGGVTFLSKAGQAAKTNFARKSIENALENQAKIDAYNAYKRGEPGYYEDQGVLRYKNPKHQPSNGTYIKNYGDIGVIETLKEQQKERLLAAEKKQSEIPDSVPITAGTVVKPTRNALGYSAADIPRGLQAQADIEKINDSISKAINGLKQSNDDNAKISASILKSLQDRISEKNEALEKAKADFRADTSEKKEASTQNLINALADLEKAVEDATTATKQFGGGGGGGGGQPPKEGFGEKFNEFRNKFGALAGAGLALAAGVAQQYYGFQATGRNVVIGQELGLQKARGDLAQLQFNREMASVDMRSGENIIKYYGDMFYGNRPGSEFLGQKGLLNANKAAWLNFESIKERDSADRSSNRISAATKIIGGAAAAIGSGIAGAASSWTGVGAMMGAAGVVYGINQVVGGIGDLRGDVTSAASAREGFEGIAGLGARLAGMSPEERAKAQARRIAEDNLEMANYSESLRNAQVQQHAKDVFLIDKQLEAKAATRQAVQLVGQYALTPNELNTIYKSVEDFHKSAKRSPTLYENGESVRAFTSQSQREKEKVENIGPFAPNTDNFKSYANTLYEKKRSDGKARLLQERQEKLAARAFPGSTPEDEENRRRLLAMGLPPSLQNIKSGEQPISTKGPTSVWASFGMSQAEWIGRAAQVTDLMSDLRPGKSTSVGEVNERTRRVLSLGFAGLGSQDQILSNLGALNQTTGQANNTQKLEQIMSQAVALGFDKSRTGQQFIGAVTDLSRSLGVTETGSMGRSLGLAATALSATGTANELSLEAAKRGVSEYASYTSQTGGFVGAMKMRAAFGAGIGFGSGAGILSGKSTEQIMSWISELDKGTITSPGLQDLMRLNGNDKEKVRKVLEGQVGAAATSIRGQFNVTFGKNAYEEAVNKVKTSSGKERDEAMATLRARAAEIAPMAGLGAEAGMQSVIQDLVVKGVLNQREATKELDKAKKEGMAKGIDPAAKNLQNYIDQATRDFNKAGGPNSVNMAKYKEYLRAGGVEQAGVTEKDIAEAERDPKKKAELEKKLEGLTTVDLAQGAERAYAATGQVQRVEITNWFGMRPVLAGTGLGDKVRQVPPPPTRQ
jgi:hypothetical protein